MKSIALLLFAVALVACGDNQTAQKPPKMGASLLYPGNPFVGFSPPSTGLNATTAPKQAVGGYIGADIDCFTLGATTTLVPAFGAGKTWSIPSQGLRFVVITRGGTLTGAPTFKAGTNGAHDNFIASMTTPTVANLNAATAGMSTTFGVTFVAGAFFGQADLATPLIMEVSTAATGAGASLVIRPVSMGQVIAYP